MANRYRLKVPPLEVIQYNGSNELDLIYFLKKVGDESLLHESDPAADSVRPHPAIWAEGNQTSGFQRNGFQTLKLGDYVLRELDGTYRVIDEEKFETIYERVVE